MVQINSELITSLFSRLALLAATLLLGASAFAANGFPNEGVYSGAITKPDGSKTALLLTLSYTGVDETAPTDEIWPVKRKMQGSFIVGAEGGPYTLKYVNYSFDTNKLELQYNRPQQNDPTLYFHGKWNTSEVISGTVNGLKDQIGTFSVKYDSKARMDIQAVLTGKYVGQAKYITGPPVSMVMHIDSSPIATTNPADMELDFTAGHVGGFMLQTWEGSLNRIYIDYFRNAIRLVYQEGGSGTLVFDGIIKGDTITGTMNSSLKGRTGEFTVKRVSL